MEPENGSNPVDGGVTSMSNRQLPSPEFSEALNVDDDLAHAGWLSRDLHSGPRRTPVVDEKGDVHRSKTKYKMHWMHKILAGTAVS